MRDDPAGRIRSRLPLCGAILSLLRLRYLRQCRVENSRNPGHPAVAMLISPMLFIVLPGSRPDAG